MQNEIWKDVVGYEGLYSVSSLGRVRSEARVVEHARYGKQSVPERILKGKTDKGGYLLAVLCRAGQKKTCKVHRLVALVFLENPENKSCVNHIDNNPKNNRLENLEWCSQAENIQHCSKQGRMRNQFTGYMTTDKIQKLYELLDKGLTLQQVAKVIGVDYRTVWNYKQKRK